MPNVEYVVPQKTGHKTCTVTTSKGQDDQANENCIQLVSGFLAKHDQAPKIIYIVHGWNEGRDTDWIDEMSKSIRVRYENKENDVIGLVFWDRAHKYSTANRNRRESSSIEKLICCFPVGPTVGYGHAAANTWQVGNILGYLNEAVFKSDNRMTFKMQTYCIGFSLGSHVCGFFGKTIKQNLGEGNKLTKIVGLDPAGPIFDFHEHFKELALKQI